MVASRSNSKLPSIILLICSTAIALIIAELVSRVAAPISIGARLFNSSGEQERLYLPTGKLRPSISLTQVAPEYQVPLSTTALGHRMPDAGENPDTVFIGDSFTFGTGLGDHETIPAIYSQLTQRSSANLGVPGTGTTAQIDRLEYFLDTHGWRPTQVIALPLMMTAELFPGNDLQDNLDYQAKINSSSPSPAVPPVDLKVKLLEASNLVRLIKLHLGPELRRAVNKDFDTQQLNQALKITQQQFSRLKNLSEKYNFQIRVLVLHPIQALLSNQAGQTMTELESVIQTLPLEDSAPILHPEPKQYYYPFDGHFNSAGAEAIGAYLSGDR